MRWAAWTPEEHTAHSVSLTYRLMAQTGYPWTLDLHLLYDLSADGLTVTHTATNLSEEPAPYAAGMHPYLTVGEPTVGRLDALELLLPAATRCLVDDRKLPTTDEPVEGTAYDFRVPRPLRDTVLDHAFTDLARDERGRAVVELRDPADGQGVGALGGCRARLAPGLQRRRAAGRPDAALAGGGADDRTGRRLQLRAGPAGPRSRPGRTATSARRPGGSGRCSAAHASSTARSSRSAWRARSPSEPWIPIAATVVPSSMSSVAHGAPRPRCDRDHGVPVEDPAPEPVHDHDALGLGGDP